MSNNTNSPAPFSSSIGDESTSIDQEDIDAPPLDQQILDIVRTCKNGADFVVRPARLSAELGISVEDATAELCGLLAAVGGGHEGASFTFSTENKVSTMVFVFPADFESRAKQRRRQEDLKQYAWKIFHIFVKAMKIVTAFGLILSLFILTIAAMIGLVVGIVALSRAGGNNSHHRNALMRQLRTICFTVRQLLWCYALFGQELEGQDPFLSEIAYDLALLSSICCTNPGSFFWWYRVGQMNRRRRRARRGWSRGPWGGSIIPNGNNNELETDVEGVYLIRSGEWREPQQRGHMSSQEEHRGLLSLAIEYLFGPSPFDPGPAEAEKWKLRGALIVHRLSSQDTTPAGISLQELGPYLDDPPKSLDEKQDVAKIVSGGLAIVAHFNGVPTRNDDVQGESVASVSPHWAKFHFPELLSESPFVTQQDALSTAEDDDDRTWESLLCATSTPNTLGRRRTGEAVTLPNYMHEPRYKLTKLQPQQLFYCFSLGVINLIGVMWLRRSLEPPEGMLQIPDNTLMATVFRKGLGPVLYFYAILFFVLPAARLLLILILNSMRNSRNERRRSLVKQLKGS